MVNKRSHELQGGELSEKALSASSGAARSIDEERAPDASTRNHTDDDDQVEASVNEFDVWWDEPADYDPENPMNWSTLQKNSTIAIVSFMTFLTPLASAMFAPGVPEVMEEFGTDSNLLATFVVAVYVLGFAFGPLIVAPISEMEGRVVVYNVCNLLFLIFTILNALSQNMGMLVTFRFLAGFAGVAPITIGSGTIADIVPPQRRGVAMSMWSLGPIIGPIIGPIAGGYLVESLGWRWVFWVLSIASGITTVVSFFLLRETYAPVILERKAARIRKSTGNLAYQSKLVSKIPARQLFRRSILRPTKMLLFSPVLMSMSIYIAVLYGLLYILFTTFTFVFQDQYGFSAGSAGLAFIGSGIGTLSGLAYVATLSDRKIKFRIANGQRPLPEDRLPLYLALPGSLTVAAGLFIYGWGAEERVHWIVPQIGNAVTGFGMIVILMCIQTYLVDAYTTHAASAIAANTVLRSLAGALVPLGGLQLYSAIGLGWGNSLLGFIAFVMSPIPILFGIFGEKIRNHPMSQYEF